MQLRSKWEQTIAKELKARGVKYEYESYSYKYEAPIRSPKAKCLVCGSNQLVRTAWYTPDFFLSNGTIIEAKGRWTAVDRRKIIAVREEHEELLDNLVMLFMRDNKIHKRSNTTYSEWCEKNGIPYSVGKLKEEWLV